ncbi:MAG: hypothetical protein QOG21_136 [Actinomycetota bacterium]|jgi:hypothetical protein|nr:hypothetical protein [Actinomycetota bacterium]
MSNAGLFAVGLVVTVLVLAGIALVIVGAILDGRDDGPPLTGAHEQFEMSAR